ncbi:Eco57I restriction-modification methylase domain-containing protein [Streptomyces sp. NPDC056949]|uniref:Eco57I restriction-modification methylase domain-containing protein n=1 Tax=Streptomyces sp. NPDC056949 TaxID=3345976 RepID=UPI003629225D
MSAATRTAPAFASVTTVGGLLPSDMLLRVTETRNLPGTKPADYGLPASVAVRDEAERAWEYLKPLWRDLRAALPSDPVTGAPAADPTGRAESDWLSQLFRKLDFGALTAVGAAGIPADSDPAKHFPVSHRHGPALIHQVPWNQKLDKSSAKGQIPPQSMLQDCLNRTEAHLWAIVTNGRQLRLLRDSSSFSTAAYVDFDLEALFDGELFSEFVLLYSLLHASRFTVAEGTAASGCWLEKWRAEAVTSGTRALDQLRLGVQNALTVLGTGFLRHPDNGALREETDPKALRDALLRLVYRLLFVFVAEDRDALLDVGPEDPRRERYEKYFSSARLRTHARRRQGTAHGDQYEALRIVLTALGTEGGRPELGLPGLGGLFSRTDADAPLDGLKLSNEALLTAVRHLAQVRDPGARRWRPVDYRHLDAEELGSVYESLLELEPKHSATDRSFELVEVAGNTRKTTGSYYTPSSLIECLLDTTLNPVIDDAVKRGEQRAAAGRPDPAEDIVDELLSLTVCDPACGSGHFLVASARRIAKRVASVREHNPEPTEDAVSHALREVVARCIYGVDLNPMAVELAKVSLWLEAMERGKALAFLDAHIKHGNGLIGATPKLLAGGIPDDAFKPIEGDDRKHASSLVKRNKAQRGGQDELLFDTEPLPGNERYAVELAQITLAASDDLTDVRKQESDYRAYVESSAYVQDLHAADAWCAAFVWPKQAGAPEAPTDQVFRALRGRDQSGVSDGTHQEILRLRDQYRFFHWHLEFPEVFAVPQSGAGVQAGTGWAGGFDAVVGNPPWERVEMVEHEFFAQRDPRIAGATNSAARKRLIAELRDDRDGERLYAEFGAAKRRAEGESHFLRSSDRFPLTGRGRINTYAVFTETDRALTAPNGRTGVIVPSGIATDATTQFFFKDIVTKGQLFALYDFENEDKVFPQVHNQLRFCLFMLRGAGTLSEPIRMVFKVRQPEQITDRSYLLTTEDILAMNPNTGTCPVFSSKRDADITRGIYRRVPVLVNETMQADGNPWGVSFAQGLFNMATDSSLFRPAAQNNETLDDLLAAGWTLNGNVLVRGEELLLPLYEAKMLHHYDHRFSTYENATEQQLNKGTLPRFTLEQHQSASAVPMPRYWAPEEDVPTGEVDKNGKPVLVPGVRSRLTAKGWDRNWLLGWRDICRASDSRTAIPAFLPAVGVGDKFLLELPTADPTLAPLLGACQSSLVFDYSSRQKHGGTSMKYFTWRQLPVPTPDQLAPYTEFITPRILELTYTATDMGGFARDLGDTGAPFRWAPDRRAVIRAELDALFFHLYGITRDDTAYILDTFNVTRDNDMKAHGEYRTKSLILAEYDRMAADGLTDYRSTLTPPPGQGPRHT